VTVLADHPAAVAGPGDGEPGGEYPYNPAVTALSEARRARSEGGDWPANAPAAAGRDRETGQLRRLPGTPAPPRAAGDAPEHTWSGIPEMDGLRPGIVDDHDILCAVRDGLKRQIQRPWLPWLPPVEPGPLAGPLPGDGDDMRDELATVYHDAGVAWARLAFTCPGCKAGACGLHPDLAADAQRALDRAEQIAGCPDAWDAMQHLLREGSVTGGETTPETQNAPQI
jgi:hypothetical protein